MKIPQTTNLQDLQSSFRDVHDELVKLRTRNIDLTGRRIINAGGARSPGDYVTRVELERAVAAVDATSATKKAAVSKPVVPPAGPEPAPTAPTNLVVVISGGNVMDWSWTAAGNHPTSYILEGGTSPGLINLFNTDTGNINTAYHEGNLPDNYYYVRVRAKNASGVSDVSNEVGFSIGGAMPSPTPNPPSPEPIPPVPVTPPFTGSAVRLISFQGATINLGTYGTHPWFGAAITSLSATDRASVYAQLLAAGDTWGMACLSWNYAEAGQPYGNGANGVVPPTDMSTNLAGFRAIVDEQLAAGFAKVLVFMAGDAEGAGPGYNDPVGWTYGRAWLMAHLSSIISAFQTGTDITPSCIFMPGFDGVMPGWDPSELDAYLLAIRALVGSTRCVGLELASGYSHWGGGSANWSSPAGQAVDFLLQEFNGPPTGDQVWQIAARTLGPAYKRPVEQPAADDPNPPYYMISGTPRGPRTVVAFEFDEFRWVRNQVAAGQINVERQSLANVGYAYVG